MIVLEVLLYIQVIRRIVGQGLESRFGVKSESRVGEDFGGKVSVYMIQVNGYGCRNLYFSFCCIPIIHTNREMRVWRLYTDDLLLNIGAEGQRSVIGGQGLKR